MRRSFDWMRVWGGDVWLPTLALVLPAILYLALVWHRLEPVEVGAYAKMEIYTRLAAEGSQRLGPESRFHLHQPGPVFFYAAAPVYVLFGETTRAMAAAALVWNIAFLLAFLRGASRLAPGVGSLAAAIVLGVLCWARGPGLMTSWFNIHVALLPFAVALLASARVATGEARALPTLVLAASAVAQCQLAWIPGVALPAFAGLVLLASPAIRRALGIPTRGPGLTLGTAAAAVLVALALWTLPVIDELTGEYHNLRRLLVTSSHSRTPTPWLETLRPAAEALSLARDRSVPFGAALGAAALVLGGWLAARRRGATIALTLMTALALVAVPIAIRYVPGRTFPDYLFEWASMVTLVALLIVGTELLGRATRQSPSRNLTAGMLAALSSLLVINGVSGAASVSGPRAAVSVAVEEATRAIGVRAAADLPPGRRFLIRVEPRQDRDTRSQAVVIGLILALDKAGLRFGVQPFGSCRLEGHLTPRGDEMGELLVGPLPSRQGAVPIGAPGGVRVVWQPPRIQ